MEVQRGGECGYLVTIAVAMVIEAVVAAVNAVKVSKAQRIPGKT